MVHQKFSQQKQRGENINSYVPKTAKVLNSLQVLWSMVFLSLSWISARTSAMEGTVMRMFSWPVHLSCPATAVTDVRSARPDLASRVRGWVNVGEEALGSCLLGKCPLTALCWVFNTPLCNNICLFFFFFFFCFKWGWEPDVGISVSWEGRCVSTFICIIFLWEILSLAD